MANVKEMKKKDWQALAKKVGAKVQSNDTIEQLVKSSALELGVKYTKRMKLDNLKEKVVKAAEISMLGNKPAPTTDGKEEAPKADNKKPETPKAEEKEETPKAEEKEETPKAEEKANVGTPKSDKVEEESDDQSGDDSVSAANDAFEKDPVGTRKVRVDDPKELSNKAAKENEEKLRKNAEEQKTAEERKRDRFAKAAEERKRKAAEEREARLNRNKEVQDIRGEDEEALKKEQKEIRKQKEADEKAKKEQKDRIADMSKAARAAVPKIREYQMKNGNSISVETLEKFGVASQLFLGQTVFGLGNIKMRRNSPKDSSFVILR